MKLEITKEQIEQQIEQHFGCKIQGLKLEPLYEGKTCMGLSVQVVPIQSIKEIVIIN
jgi:hypothetical protein